jgi:hypothetical protein
LNPTNTIAEREPSCITGRAYDYILYGMRLRTRVKLTLEEARGHEIADIELSPAEPHWMEAKISGVEFDDSDWINIHALPGGWSYVRYEGMFDFLISPSGEGIFYRLLAKVTPESFQTYALGRIFSFALVKKGYEPLHAATVVVNERAVAFMGATTFGKSSLAACFVAAGYPLLTDDVLRLEERDDGYIAYPGPPRLKLFPRIARLYLGDFPSGIPINNRSLHPKRVFSLAPSQTCAMPTAVRGIYVVTAPRRVYRKQQIAISSLPAVDALVKVLSFTHNHELTGKERLVRQFEAARRLIDKVSVRSLSYPRILQSLPEVRAAILADLE